MIQLLLCPHPSLLQRATQKTAQQLSVWDPNLQRNLQRLPNFVFNDCGKPGYYQSHFSMFFIPEA